MKLKTIGLWFCFLMMMILFMIKNCMASVQKHGRLDLGFQGAQMYWIDNDGLILLSNNSNFAFGFSPTQDVTLFLLVVVHKSSTTVVWSANRGSPVSNSDDFVFDKTGNAFLQVGGSVIWETDTAGKGVAAMELLDSGNLVLVGNDSRIIWQSFSHPTDTLLSNQEFSEGMKLVSNANSNNLNHTLEITSGDMILSASFQNPQTYWAISKDSRIIINQNGGNVAKATLVNNSWNFYDKDGILLWNFVFSPNTDVNATWVAVLGYDGSITFTVLPNGGSSAASLIVIPQDQCSRPEACGPYLICYSGNRCQCPPALPSCKPGNASQLCEPGTELVDAGDSLSYFALPYVTPAAKTSLSNCKNICLANCSCKAMFFDNKFGSCYTFNQIGSLQGSTGNGSAYATYIKISSSGATQSSSSNGNNNSSKRIAIVVSIVCVTLFVILALLVAGYFYLKKKNHTISEPNKESSEEDNFLESLSGMPVRFTYKDLQTATNNFEVKLGQGGFGSVYQGSLPDGTQIAVKKLEGIGQGKKEFRAEVSIIGSIHHHHLVKLRGFCADGSHRMLVYEYMANGSLDRWLFKKNKGEFLLNWDTRYNIALGTAKGLAYLHEDCDVKIVHCDIKPENVLLDGNYLAKVSDFGLAKLMTREQSHVFTTLRGTRGYLAPEWITNYAISEKSDVYSYGMVLLEIIGGRKNYDPSETSGKAHFPTYAFKMMEEGKLKDIIDEKLRKNAEEDESVLNATKVALWCIQDDMSLRPPMTKVVQMLEGICIVPPPPVCSLLGGRLYSGFMKSLSSEGTSSGPSDTNSDTFLSAVRLSGPR